METHELIKLIIKALENEQVIESYKLYQGSGSTTNYKRWNTIQHTTNKNS